MNVNDFYEFNYVILVANLELVKSLESDTKPL